MRLSPSLQARIANRLTPRDHAILDDLHTHRVLTTAHIAALHWHRADSRQARTRLLEMHRLHLIDRFRPHRRIGSAPWHWVLAPAGAHILAQARNVPIDDLGYRHDHVLSLAHSSRLSHTTGVLDCYVAALTTARTTPHAALTTWWDEKKCAAEWGEHTRPDAYARWHHNDTTIEAFLEYDTGTETLDRVSAKMSGYADLAAHSGLITPVLIVTKRDARESHLATHLRPVLTSDVPVRLTTHARFTNTGPLGCIWRLAGPAHDGRHRLLDLAHP